MPIETKITWNGGKAFTGEFAGHKVIMDATKEFGGEEKGPTPKALLLFSLAGCAGIDVVSILGSMRVEIDSLEMEVVGELLDDTPARFSEIKMVYRFKGQDLPLKKLERAVKLSKEKYCGVSASFSPEVNIAYEVVVE